jgi:hypothetical protein
MNNSSGIVGARNTLRGSGSMATGIGKIAASPYLSHYHTPNRNVKTRESTRTKQGQCSHVKSGSNLNNNQSS